MLLHELQHYKHKDGFINYLINLAGMIYWFNPFVWIAGRWLQEVHEWEADRDVLDAGYDLTEYRTVIFFTNSSAIIRI